jgi:hypothetical protein
MNNQINEHPKDDQHNEEIWNHYNTFKYIQTNYMIANYSIQLNKLLNINDKINFFEDEFEIIIPNSNLIKNIPIKVSFKLK